jgi:hypothetical protein
MATLTPFLVGGPAYSGTTLLALLCNQAGMVCLDEPDFEDPAQAHRGVPVLRALYPDAAIPDPPDTALTRDQAFVFMLRCAGAIHPTALGIKTCDRRFVEFADRFRARKLPVVAIVRDIRDALVRPLPEWLTEAHLNAYYRLVWEYREFTSTWIRYESLVLEPEETLRIVADALHYDGTMKTTWDADNVPGAMIKNHERHALLRTGAIARTRIGLGRSSGMEFSPETLETASMMGYPE